MTLVHQEVMADTSDARQGLLTPSDRTVHCPAVVSEVFVEEVRDQNCDVVESGLEQEMPAVE